MWKKSLIPIALFIFFAVPNVIAQNVTDRITPNVTAPVITAAAGAERARFTAPSSVVQMQLQVYADSGQLLFDVTSKGNVLDWTLQDSGGTHLVPGSYLCVVTVKSLSGKLSQRIGSLAVEEKQVELRRVEPTQLTAPQQQAVGPIEENAALTILKTGEVQAATVLANDGNDGHLIRGRGALTFRVGDFFSGNDKEQMRLTEEGNLGIGTSTPQAKLDVAGSIRTNRGIEFADGTIQTTGLSGRKDKDGNIVPNVAGTGTTNQVTKWTDNTGTLGDSAITEVGGRVGIGTNSPTYRLVVGPDIGSGLTTSDLTISRGAGQSVSIYAGATGAHGMNFGWDESNLRAFVNAPVQSPITFTHGGVSERMRIETNGNIGIGTPAPTSLLHVLGSQPPPNPSGNGTNATPVLQVIGGNGGDGGLNGGAGANVLVQAGNAGNGNLFSGAGGSITLQGGAGGTGAGGSIILLPGAPFNGNVNGNVGIGIQSLPSVTANALFVANDGGDNRNSFRLDALENNLYLVARSGSPSAAGIVFRTAPNSIGVQEQDRMAIIGNGNVGIGTITPTAKLEIAGDAKVSNNLAVDTNTLFVDATNHNVGIGTTAPAYKLHVVGQEVRVEAGNFPRFSLNFTGGNPDEKRWRNYAAPNLLSFTALADNDTFQTSWLDVNRGTGTAISSVVFPSGNVGIGTTTPGFKLQVVDPSNAGLKVQTAAQGGTLASFGGRGDFQIDAEGTVGGRLTVKEGGNVGIGTNAPTAKLHLGAGDVYVGGAGQGIILKSPSGLVCARLTIDNTGVLTTSGLPCP